MQVAGNRFDLDATLGDDEHAAVEDGRALQERPCPAHSRGVPGEFNRAAWGACDDPAGVSARSVSGI